MTSPELEIVWDGGSLDLMGENDTDNGPVTIHALADGTDWGNPESVRRELWRALSDGSISAIDSWKNRTIPLRLKLSAGDSLALAGGEKPLHMLSGVRRAELRWTPPNVFAAPAVFIVTASDLSHNMDDLAENRSERYYTLTLSCLPFARSLDGVSIAALAPFVTAPTVLDDCTTTTGWTTTATSGTASVAVSSGAVVISVPSGATARTVVATITKSMPRSKRYLAIEVEVLGGQVVAGSIPVTVVRTSLGGIWVPNLVGVEGKWLFLDVPPSLGSVEEIRFQVRYPSEDGISVPVALAQVLTIAESDVPAATAGRQSLRVFPTPGSADAPASILVERRTSPQTLGEAIIYTGPQYDPRLSVGRIAFDAIDGTALSGKTDNDTVFTFFRRASEFPPGIFTLWGNPQLPLTSGSPTPGSINWTVAVSLVDDSGGIITSQPTFTVTTTHTAGSEKRMRCFGLVALPGADLPKDSPYRVKFVLTSNVTAVWDEGLVFHQDGQLTIVDTNGNGATRVLAEAATLEHNARVMRGSGNSTQDVPVSMLSELRNWGGTHMFTPDETYLYVGTTGAVDAKVTGSFRPTWHTHPTQ